MSAGEERRPRPQHIHQAKPCWPRRCASLLEVGAGQRVLSSQPFGDATSGPRVRATQRHRGCGCGLRLRFQGHAEAQQHAETRRGSRRSAGNVERPRPGTSRRCPRIRPPARCSSIEARHVAVRDQIRAVLVVAERRRRRPTSMQLRHALSICIARTSTPQSSADLARRSRSRCARRVRLLDVDVVALAPAADRLVADVLVPHAAAEQIVDQGPRAARRSLVSCGRCRAVEQRLRDRGPPPGSAIPRRVRPGDLETRTGCPPKPFALTSLRSLVMVMPSRLQPFSRSRRRDVDRRARRSLALAPARARGSGVRCSGPPTGPRSRRARESDARRRR